MGHFRWTETATAVALDLAQGYTQIDTALRCNIHRNTIQRWLKDSDFAAEVDRLSLMVGIASRAERLRIAQRAIRARTPGDTIYSKADLIDWLKYAQSETNGIKLDLPAAFAALFASVTGSEQGGIDPAGDGPTDPDDTD